jgi:DUF1365 family protein
MHSAILSGQVRHHRIAPKVHSFDYGVHFLMIDLEEVSEVFRGRWFWSIERPNLISFKRSDYLGPIELPLRGCVLDLVESELGRRPQGRVSILTQVRTFGYLFNPVSFYFCHDEEGGLDAIVAEITNTPWGERHSYVLDAGCSVQAEGKYAFEFEKAFHISPFFQMQQSYRWEFRWERDQVEVQMTNSEAGKAVFSVSLSCQRQEISGRSLAAALLRFPLQPLRLHFAIYWQAARLFFKRVPVFTHPKSTPLAARGSISTNSR